MRAATFTETSENIHSSIWSHTESRRTLFPTVLRHFSIYILQFSSYDYIHSGSEHFSSFALLAMKKPISNVSVSEMFNLGSRSYSQVRLCITFSVCSVLTPLPNFVLPQSFLPSISISK